MIPGPVSSMGIRRCRSLSNRARERLKGNPNNQKTTGPMPVEGHLPEGMEIYLLDCHHVVAMIHHVMIESFAIPTQESVAKAVGLSRVTVSHILSGREIHRYKEETRQKVLEAAERLGYRPHRGAQMMRRGTSNLVVLLNMTGMNTAYHTAPLFIGQNIVNAGFDVQVVEAFWWPQEGAKIMEQILSLRPLGVVAIGSPQISMELQRLRQYGVPLVSVAFRADPSITWFRHDVQKAIYELTLSALAMGRERIGLFLRWPFRGYSWNQHQRQLGFEAALAEAGWAPPTTCAFPESLPARQGKREAVIYFDTHKAEHFNQFDSAYATAEWLKGRSDALICGNDQYALSAFTCLYRNGLTVPGDVCLSGFDNAPFTAMGAVPITSVEPPVKKICDEAIAHLLKLIGGEKHEPMEQIYPCNVIWRDSLPFCGTPQSTTEPALPSTADDAFSS